jgi:hypothetical protein
MVARDRFGGLYSVLNRRDLADMDRIEHEVVEDEPAGSNAAENHDMVWLDEDLNFSAVSPDYTLQEIADHLESVHAYFMDVLTWTIGEDSYSFTEDQRINYGISSGRIRGYMGTVDRILRKVKRAIRKLDTEALD